MIITRWRNYKEKIWQFFHSKLTPFFSKKLHLFSGHVADIQRTSCILCSITFLLHACYKRKNGHFSLFSCKKIAKKIWQFFPY